jgi:hypothetical protein
VILAAAGIALLALVITVPAIRGRREDLAAANPKAAPGGRSGCVAQTRSNQHTPAVRQARRGGHAAPVRRVDHDFTHTKPVEVAREAITMIGHLLRKVYD